MKTLIALIVVSTFSSNLMAWTLTHQDIQIPDGLCWNKIKLEQTSKGPLVYADRPNNTGFPDAPIANFLNANQGKICVKNTSDHSFGGMKCQETKLKNNEYVNAFCSTEFASFTCEPFAKKTIVTSMSMSANKLVFTETVKYYDGNTYTNTCSYKKP